MEWLKLNSMLKLFINIFIGLLKNLVSINDKYFIIVKWISSVVRWVLLFIAFDLKAECSNLNRENKCAVSVQANKDWSKYLQVILNLWDS